MNEVPALKIGVVVEIRSGHTNKVIITGNVSRVSKSGRRVCVVDANGRTRAFYRDDRQGSDRTRFIQDPGAGILGHAFNDYFRVVYL